MPPTPPTPLLYQPQYPGHSTTVRIGHTVLGGSHVPVIAGPCSVESLEQLRTVAQALQKSGIHCLRAGAYKPRTSPYAFQGLRKEGLELLGQIRQEFGLAIVSEVMSIAQIQEADPFLDCFQVGARNMQNFDLLRALGQQPKPILLKRGLSATLEEFLLAAEYILAEGNGNVILCERGIRGFDTATRNVLDLASVALLQEKTHLPIIVDPSHATGLRSLVIPAARAAVAVGADGVIVEAHPVPEQSVSDASQAISLEELASLVVQIDAIQTVVGRPSPTPAPC